MTTNAAALFGTLGPPARRWLIVLAGCLSRAET
jgi:hypothetical protein